MRLLSKSSFILTICVGMLATSCSDDPLAVDNEVQSALDYAHIQHEFNYVPILFQLGAEMSDGLSKMMEMSGILGMCSNISLKEIASDKVQMIVDYGEACKCFDGHTRSGKLVGTFTGEWNSDQAQLSIVPERYHVTTSTGNLLNFDFILTVDKNFDTSGKESWNTQIHDAQILTSSGNITWNATQQIEQVAGTRTLEIEDDLYQFAGTVQGVASNQVAFDVSVLEPVALGLSCFHMTGGVIEFTPAGRQPRIIDFGEGSCDTEAKIQIAGFTRQIRFDDL